MDEGDGPYKAFGEWMKSLRLGAGLDSQPRAVQSAHRRGFRLIKQGKLSHLERGWNANPKPELFRELALLYAAPYPAIVARWVQARFGVDLGELKLTIDDFASKDEVDWLQRLRDLDEADHQAIVRHLNALAGQLPRTDAGDDKTPEEGNTSKTGSFTPPAWDGTERRKSDSRQAG